MANRMISFGYGIDGNKICVIDREAVVVCEIFEKYAAGKLLQEIADELTARNVDFFQGNCNWNKNRVSRIIGNKKYIGADDYPPIVGNDLFQSAYGVKNTKGFKKEHFSGNIEYLKKNIVCAQCGKLMTRRTKWRSREKWICGNGCKNEVYVDDALIFAEFGKIFIAIKDDLSLLDNPNSGKSSSYSFEEIQCRNELRKIMDAPEPDFNKGRNLIFKLAKLKYSHCKEQVDDTSKEQLLNAIKEETENVPGLVSENFLNEYVSKLQIEQNGSITVTFMNGSVVSSDMGGEKFSECGKKDHNANRSGSEKESGERRTFDTPYSGVLSCVNG